LFPGHKIKGRLQKIAYNINENNWHSYKLMLIYSYKTWGR
jgi:hypothetical protein